MLVGTEVYIKVRGFSKHVDYHAPFQDLPITIIPSYIIESVLEAATGPVLAMWMLASPQEGGAC